MSNIQAPDIAKLAIHTFTNKPWDLSTCLAKYKAAGLKAFTLWRYHMVDEGLEAVALKVKASGLIVSAIARSGFFTGSVEERKLSLTDNKQATFIKFSTLRKNTILSLVIIGSQDP